MTARVRGLIVAEAVLVAVGLWVLVLQPAATDRRSPVTFLLFVAAMAALGMLPRVHLELRRQVCWITPSDCALMVGLFVLSPLAFVTATLLAEIVAAVRNHRAWLKTSFNLVHMLGGAVAAAVVFASFGRSEPSDPAAWVAGGVALAALAAWDLLSTAAVLAIAEKRAFRTLLGELLSASAVSLAVSVMLGIVALVLVAETRVGPILFAPVLGILLTSTRAVSRQRAERDRFERLYGASSNLARSLVLADTLATIAAEGRSLVTGAAAVCCVVREDGSASGMLLDDDGARQAPPDALERLAVIAATGDRAEAHGAVDGRTLGAALPDAASMVWASRQADPSGRVILAVFRDLAPDDQDAHRADILVAFVAHAATVVANAGLHEDVQQALERQVVLNRQKSEFVAAVSHELRTPLAGVIGSVQTIHRCGDTMPAADRQEMLELGLDQGARLLGLIEDLLLVAAADHDEVRSEDEPVDVGALVGAIGRELPEAVRTRLRTSVDEAVGTVVSDRDKVRRILLNLVENAGKYAPSGPIEVDVRRDGDRVRLAVSDHGPGIAVQDRERVFERFVQLDGSAARRQGGTGLGLHLCRQLTGILGGELSVTEAAGGGARLELVLPGALAVCDPSSAPAAGTSPPRGLTRSPLKRPPGLPTSSGEGARPTRSPLAVPLGGGTS